MDAETIVDRAAGAAIATNERGRIVCLNHDARTLLGYSKNSDVLGKPMLELLEVRDIFGNHISKQYLDFWDLASRGEAVNTFEYILSTASGKGIKVSITIIVVLGRQQGDFRVVHLMRQVHRRRRADEAIEKILASREYLNKDVLGPGDGGERARTTLLTPRQVEVLRWMKQGASSKEIAKSLGVSITTVRTHKQRLFNRLRVHSQLEALAKASEMGLL